MDKEPSQGRGLRGCPGPGAVAGVWRGRAACCQCPLVCLAPTSRRGTAPGDARDAWSTPRATVAPPPAPERRGARRLTGPKPPLRQRPHGRLERPLPLRAKTLRTTSRRSRHEAWPCRCAGPGDASRTPWRGGAPPPCRPHASTPGSRRRMPRLGERSSPGSRSPPSVGAAIPRSPAGRPRAARRWWCAIRSTGATVSVPMEQPRPLARAERLPGPPRPTLSTKPPEDHAPPGSIGRAQSGATARPGRRGPGC